MNDPLMFQQLVWGIVAVVGIICTTIYKVKSLKYPNKNDQIEMDIPSMPFRTQDKNDKIHY